MSTRVCCGLLQVDKPPEEPSQTQITGVAIASARDNSHETSATADSPSLVVRPEQWEDEAGYAHVSDRRGSARFECTGRMVQPERMDKFTGRQMQSQPAPFEPSMTKESDQKPIMPVE